MAVTGMAVEDNDLSTQVSRPGRRSAGSGRGHAVRLTLALLLLIRTVAVAQDVTEPALKAAFIFNFAKFTDWPDQLPAAEPFVLCVLGDAAVGDALERAVVGQVLKGHRVVASRLAAGGPKQLCHVLYVSGVSAAQAGALVAELHDRPTLTISDIAGFTSAGGIAEFFFEDGHLRFRIQLVAVKRARLQISSKLLTLAKTR
jgi:YfiR/HmsC-like